MATTVKHQPNTATYIEVINGTTNEFLLQNTSKNRAPVHIVWAAAQPAADTEGHLLTPGDALTRNSLAGKVFARATTTDALIIATEE